MGIYSLKLPKNIYSGENALDNIVPIVKGRYIKATVFTDPGIRDSGTLDIPVSKLRETGIQVEIFDWLPSEPTCRQAQETIDAFKKIHSDLIVAVGGGSVMDIAKLASIAATDEYGVADLLENPLRGRKMVATLMIPTTAGTGSEATPNSIVAVSEKELKVGIVNEEMLADYVILDSTMIRNLPVKIAASTGADALCHAIECYTSAKANPFSDLFAMQAMKLIFANIEKACMNPDAMTEKSNMLLAAFYGGVAITASGTTAVHALSYPLGGKYHIPHGIANAVMLVPVMRFNQEACEKEFAEIYDVLCGAQQIEKKVKSRWVVEKIEEIIRNLGLPTTLAGYGVDKKDIDGLVTAGMDVKRLLNNNKRTVTSEDARRLYSEVLK
jgi:alcohol dehydrogenase